MGSGDSLPIPGHLKGLNSCPVYVILMVDDLAWAAGFIDGEGCISVAKHPGKVSPAHQLHIDVMNTNKTAIEELQRIFSLGSITKRERKGCRLIYRWHVGDYGAAKVLTGILPYLRVKKDEADAGLDFIVLRGATGGSGMRPLTDEVVAMRDAYRIHLQELKRC